MGSHQRKILPPLPDFEGAPTFTIPEAIAGEVADLHAMLQSALRGYKPVMHIEVMEHVTDHMRALKDLMAMRYAFAVSSRGVIEGSGGVAEILGMAKSTVLDRINHFGLAMDVFQNPTIGLQTMVDTSSLFSGLREKTVALKEKYKFQLAAAPSELQTARAS